MSWGLHTRSPGAILGNLVAWVVTLGQHGRLPIYRDFPEKVSAPTRKWVPANASEARIDRLSREKARRDTKAYIDITSHGDTGTVFLENA